MNKSNSAAFDVLKTNTIFINEKKEFNFPYIITSEQAQTIINAACDDWKNYLANLWAKHIVLKKDIFVSKIEYTKMIKACNETQRRLFKQIFIVK